MNEVVNWLSEMLPKLKALVAEERRIGVEILDLLAECERRKAYVELGCDGLFSFCVKVLGFTEAQSYQRIQAMRAMRATPELKQKIETGVMSVSTVAQVQGVIRKERAQGIVRTAEERRALFQQFENKTSQEVKKEIALVMGQRIRLRVTLELDEEAESLWRQVKEQSAHQTGGDELNLMKMLMREWLGKKNQILKMGEIRVSSATDAKPDMNSSVITNARRGISWSKRRIPVALQRQVYQRDQGKCMNCGSKYALQIDHIVPFAKVLKHELSNLRLLCRNCNLGYGVKQFGLETMKR